MKTNIQIAMVILLLMFAARGWAQHSQHPHSRSSSGETSTGEASGHKQMQEEHVHEALPGPGASERGSIYRLRSDWVNQRNESVKLQDFAGGPLIVVMFYGNCLTVCPTLIHDARRLSEKVHELSGDSIRVLAITFDPANDTPEALAEYARKYRIDGSNWQFLTGHRSGIRSLATTLGVRYRERSDGMFDHSNLVTILNSEGEIVEQVEGLGRSMEQPARTAVSLFQEKFSQNIISDQ